MARARRISKPESYVTRRSAARMLRQMAVELEFDIDDDRLVSVAVERKWATKEEVQRSLQAAATASAQQLDS